MWRRCWAGVVYTMSIVYIHTMCFLQVECGGCLCHGAQQVSSLARTVGRKNCQKYTGPISRFALYFSVQLRVFSQLFVLLCSFGYAANGRIARERELCAVHGHLDADIPIYRVIKGTRGD